MNLCKGFDLCGAPVARVLDNLVRSKSGQEVSPDLCCPLKLTDVLSSTQGYSDRIAPLRVPGWFTSNLAYKYICEHRPANSRYE